jgi:hypothetical protein
MAVNPSTVFILMEITCSMVNIISLQKEFPMMWYQRVQVLENHQPMKVLKDAVQSESAAMNIVLKDKARLKIMGTGDAAVGTPSVYNVSANAMLFQKKVKFINYIK